MRSRAELTFRARQEAVNLLLLVMPPRFTGERPGPLALPDAAEVVERLRGSRYAKEIVALAEKVVVHRFPIFGQEIETGPKIKWRRDYVHGRESGTTYFRRLPYLDFGTVGDHKFVWEINRHQHLVLLAQAYLISRRGEFCEEVWAELSDWLEQNPFQRGINWASALEVAFRALSWIWVYHLVGNEMPEGLARQFLTGLERHGWHLAENLSVYFSPNTHLLGEAVALHALGKLFPEFRQSAAWEKRGAEIVESQLVFQVREDGSHFEQSTYYHVYAVDLFLFHHVISGRPHVMQAGLERMADYLYWLLGPARRISCVGDDDGGRLFHPYGAREQFGRATLATCGLLFGRPDWLGTEAEWAEQAAWWLGAETKPIGGKVCVPKGNRFFRDSGTAFLQAGDLYLQMDCGPFGFGGAGHSHSDTLSVLLWLGEEPVLVDPGTFTYIADSEERNWFRGSMAHNTLQINGVNQGETAGPFRWSTKPEVTMLRWEPGPQGGLIEAECRYGGFVHRRRVELESEGLKVVDEVEGRDGEHAATGVSCEQRWQLGSGALKTNFQFSAAAERVASKFSRVYGQIEAREALLVRVRGPWPVTIAAMIETNGHGATAANPGLLDAIGEGKSGGISGPVV